MIGRLPRLFPLPRWRYRRTIRALAVAILAISLLDHVGAFGYSGDDAVRFDGRQVKVIGVAGPLTLKMLGPDGSAVRIRLLGVAEPEDDQAKALLDQELQSQVGKSLLVRLDLPRRRGPDGAVQAYLWLSERQMLNQMLVQEGWALANDSEPFIYQGTFAAGQQEARQKRAGIWSLNAEPPTHHGGHRRRAAGLSAE